MTWAVERPETKGVVQPVVGQGFKKTTWPLAGSLVVQLIEPAKGVRLVTEMLEITGAVGSGVEGGVEVGAGVGLGVGVGVGEAVVPNTVTAPFVPVTLTELPLGLEAVIPEILTDREPREAVELMANRMEAN